MGLWWVCSQHIRGLGGPWGWACCSESWIAVWLPRGLRRRAIPKAEAKKQVPQARAWLSVFQA